MLTQELINLIESARETVFRLSNDYHNGGLWSGQNDLCGYCGIASRFLVSLARSKGIEMKLACGGFDGFTHSWVEYDGFCIDLTISQFSGFEHKKYKICRVDDDFYRRYYSFDVKGSAAVSFQKKWGYGQDYGRHSKVLWKIYNSLGV